MKKHRKAFKLLSVTLAFLLFIAAVPFSAFAAATSFDYTVNSDGTCTLTAINGSAKSVVIPETIDGHRVTALGDALFTFANGPSEVTLPTTVKSYTKYTFSFSTILEKVNVAAGNPVFCSVDGVLYSADKTVLHYFPVAKTTDRYVIPEGVTQIADSAFYKTAVPEIVLPSTLKAIGSEAFEYNRVLKNVILPDGLQKIGAHAFHGCYCLTDMYIPDGCSDLGVMLFAQCKGLQSVRLPNDLTKISGGMCSECTSLNEITIPNGVTTIGDQAFYKCPIEQVTIPVGVTTIERAAFQECPIMSVTIPETVTSIGNSAFYHRDSRWNKIIIDVYGVSGSAAEEYAAREGYNFNPLTATKTLTLDHNTDTVIIKTVGGDENTQSFTVTIPAEVIINWGERGVWVDYTVESHLTYNNRISITIAGNKKMTCHPVEDVTLEIPYTLTGLINTHTATVGYFGEEATIYPAINKFGRVNVSPETWDSAVVAAYSDNLTFTASVVDVTA